MSGSTATGISASRSETCRLSRQSRIESILCETCCAALCRPLSPVCATRLNPTTIAWIWMREMRARGEPGGVHWRDYHRRRFVIKCKSGRRFTGPVDDYRHGRIPVYLSAISRHAGGGPRRAFIVAAGSGRLCGGRPIFGTVWGNSCYVFLRAGFCPGIGNHCRGCASIAGGRDRIDQRAGNPAGAPVGVPDVR